MLASALHSLEQRLFCLISRYRQSEKLSVKKYLLHDMADNQLMATFRQIHSEGATSAH